MTDEQMAEIKRYFGVVADGLRGEIRQVAEGVVNVNERLDRQVSELRQEMRDGFEDVKALMRVSYEGLDQRLSPVERRVDTLERRGTSPKQ